MTTTSFYLVTVVRAFLFVFNEDIFSFLFDYKGHKEEALRDCEEAISNNPKYVKALARRANIYEELDKPHEALKDVENVLSIDPKHIEALCAARRLPDKIKEKDEKLKAEMMGN